MTGSFTYSRDADVAASAREQLDTAAATAASFADVQRQLVATLIDLWPNAAWLAAGVTSAKNWLLAYTTLSYNEAHRLEQVAELCATHPTLAGAVISGAMPIKRAATLARFVTPERAPYLEEILPTFLELDANTTDDEAFRHAVQYWAGQVDQHTAPRKDHPHTLAMTPSLFGGGQIHAHLSPAAVANARTAIEAWTQDPDPTDAPYQRDLRERQADALDDMCAASLTGTDHNDHDDYDYDWDDCDCSDRADHADHEQPPSERADGDVGDDADDADDDWDDATFEDLRASDTFDGTSDTDELDEWIQATDAGEDITQLDALRRRLRSMETHRRRRARRRTRIRSGATINAIIDIRTLLGLRDDTDLEDLVLRGDGWHLTHGLLERLLCDSALLATLFDGKNKILDANTRAEQFSKAQRRALAARDRCCVFPGCNRKPRHCDAHHLDPRGHDGPTTTANGALLCRFHHRLIHEYRWRLQVHNGHWIAIDRHGHTWTGRPAPPPYATAA